MIVKGDLAAVDTTLLPFMRSNCIYTSDIAMLPYRGYHNIGHEIGASAWMISPTSVSRLTVAGPSETNPSASKHEFPTPRSG